MMQPGFAGVCPTCGTFPGTQPGFQQWMGPYAPIPAGFGFAPGWTGGITGFGGWGFAPPWQPGFGPFWQAGPAGFGPWGFGFGPFTTAGYGLGGLRRWGGTYTPQYTATGLPTDEEITEMIYDALDDDPLIPWDADINVEVDAGTVTLTGTVPDKRIKHAAGDDAWWIPGVVDVHNEIQVTGRHRYRARAEEADPSRRGRPIFPYPPLLPTAPAPPPIPGTPAFQ